MTTSDIEMIVPTLRGGTPLTPSGDRRSPNDADPPPHALLAAPCRARGAARDRGGARLRLTGDRGDRPPRPRARERLDYGARVRPRAGRRALPPASLPCALPRCTAARAARGDRGASPAAGSAPRAPRTRARAGGAAARAAHGGLRPVRPGVRAGRPLLPHRALLDRKS